MLKRLALPCLAMIFAGAVLDAQSTWLGGPVSGLVYDQFTKTIRPIVGVPGSAYLGPGVAGQLDFAAVSPNGKLALAVRGGALCLANLTGAQPDWRTLESESGPVESIVWSADSTAAVVAGRSMKLWSHLDADPSQLSLLEVDGSRWSSFVLVPGSEDVLAGRDGGVYRLSASDTPRLVVPVPSPSSMALGVSNNVVYVVDRVNRQILALRHWDDSPEVSLVADASLGVKDPVAVAVAADDRSLLVADASRALIVLDPESRSVTGHWDLEFQPTRVERFSSGLYLLNSRTAGTQPLQVLATGAQPAVFFIPGGDFAQESQRSAAGDTGRGRTNPGTGSGRR